ncbi:DUF6997 domain-containing protein [Bacillus rhizoplanae]|uniref:DUF6997 domain-containing protein n=1 Tax=Bacillus rhizoplanae TaxID=2880966 RepID=UPI003D2466B4
MEGKFRYQGKSIFDPIVEQLSTVDVEIFGPIPFFDYLEQYGFPRENAPQHISIDSLEVLSKSLREADSMVMRLGRGDFAVVKVKNKLNDFFLLDKEIFSNEGEFFYPKVKPNQLLAYKLLPKLTEGSLVNLGFSTGLISFALELDEANPIFPPATCNSTFSFDFLPHSLIEHKLSHNKGQVEIDAMFVEKRNGKNTLFVLESKSGNTHKSLAKHKLIYPLLGIANQVPKDIPIVPVYLKVLKSSEGIHFHIVECNYPNPRS